MTTVVIYTEDLEPITVIDVPQWALDRMKTGEPIRFVPVQPSVTPWGTVNDSYVPVKLVTIWAEPFVRGNTRTVILFTRDDDLALTLRSDVLPGQRKAMQGEYIRGFVDGLIKALGGE